MTSLARKLNGSWVALTPAPPALATPIAAFTSTLLALAGLFDATASSSGNGAIVGYAWDFGDGKTGTGISASHTYATAGTYTVSLTVTDSVGQKNTKTATVTATAPASTFVLGSTKPNASNTGVGIIAAKPTTVWGVEGKNWTTADNQVIENVIIRGGVYVKHKNVTVRNCIITPDNYAIWGVCVDPSAAYDTSSVTVEYCEIYCRSAPATNNQGAIGYRNITARRNNIHDIGDGFEIYYRYVGGYGHSAPVDTVIEGNYVHDAMVQPTNNSNGFNHCDGVQIKGGSNLTIRGNNFAWNRGALSTYTPNPGSGDASDGYPTAGCMFSTDSHNSDSSDYTPISDTVIDKNWFDCWSLTVNASGGLNRKGAVGHNTGLVITNNKLGRHGLLNADIIINNADKAGFTISGNVFEDTGADLGSRFKYLTNAAP